jgi:hypothetical protein
MKKHWFILLALLLLALPMQAQQSYRLYHPNEISTSFGFSLIDYGVSMIDKANLTYVDPETGRITGIHSGGSRGAYNIGYSRQLNCCISVGGSFGFNRTSINGIIYNANLTLASANIYSLMGTAKFDWFHTRNDVFCMYSKVGLGVMVVQGIVLQGLLNGAFVAPTFQTSFVCLEVGKVVYGFMELGMGMQGIVQVGVRTRF